MKFDELPLEAQKYNMKIDNEIFIIDGNERAVFLNEKSNTIVLKNGTIINKTAFKYIKKNVEATKDHFSRTGFGKLESGE